MNEHFSICPPDSDLLVVTHNKFILGMLDSVSRAVQTVIIQMVISPLKSHNEINYIRLQDVVNILLHLLYSPKHYRDGATIT